MKVTQQQSRLDGNTIFGALTGHTVPSRNIKTGAMSQLWILHHDLNPIEAAQCGADASVCGNCPMRGPKRRCYVRLEQAPLQVWKAHRDSAVGHLRRRIPPVRLGAYGDPGALAPQILHRLIKAAQNRWTGYTSLWRKRMSLRNLCMASVHSETEAHAAWDMGWRTFRDLRPGDRLTHNEILCPNFTHDTKCIDCNLCVGTSTNAKSIAVPGHGKGFPKQTKWLT